MFFFTLEVFPRRSPRPHGLATDAQMIAAERSDESGQRNDYLSCTKTVTEIDDDDDDAAADDGVKPFACT